MAEVVIELPDDLFAGRKTAEQLATEVRRAAAAWWLASGELSAPEAETVARGGPPAQGIVAQLLSMPAVGDDADFERPQDAGREDSPRGS